MELMSTVSAFASIVGLIGQFRSEDSSSAQSDFDEFIEWLVKTQHDEIKNLLLINAKATIVIKALLKEDRDEIINKLEYLNNALISFASGLNGFSELAEAIKPDSMLSEQVINILSEYEKRNSSRLLEVRVSDKIILHFLDGKCGQAEIREPRFIDDDLRSLVELRLLRLDHNSSGKNIYVFTRAASAFLNSRK